MSQGEINWYQVNNIDDIDTPALLFYPERIKENIAILKGFINDVTRLRPHVKTHKCSEVTQLLHEAGITKFKCATIAEAEMLAINKAPDVLLAYQPFGNKISRFIQLIKHYNQTNFSCLVDNSTSLTYLSEAAAKEGITLNVFIDVNIGMNRTGVLPQYLLALYREVTSVKAVAFTGIHAYDGHIYTTDLEQRTKETLACFYLLKGVINKIEAEGNIKVLVVAGGTPTFPIYAKIDGIECSPGTFVFSDYGYQQRFPDMPFKPAAIIATRVMSLINENTVCLDLGHKSIAAENILNERIRFLNAPEVEFIGHSEEHLVIRCEQKNCFKIGDVLYGLPVHICPSCALYDYANIIVENNIVDEWAIIARKRKINI